MIRPCFLVLDREHASSISTRKLVIETAKFNVITAYSAGEALETFATFPAINAVVLDSSVKDLPCDDVVAKLKSAAPELPIIVVRAPGGQSCAGADHYLDTFEPAKLLELLAKLRPREAAEIERQNEELSRKGE